MDKKDKLKCYTRTAGDGHRYVACDDKSKEKRKERPKKLVLKKKAPKEIATDAMNAIKEVKNMSGNPKLKKQFIERVRAEIDEPSPNTTAKPKSPLRGGVGLRPEISKLVQDFARPTGMVSNLMEKIVKAKGSLDRKARLLDKYNNSYNKQQPFLFPRELKKEGKEYDKVIDNIIRFRKKRDTLRKAQPTELVNVGSGLKSKRLIKPLNPEYVVEDAKIQKDLKDAEDLSRSMGYSLSLGEDKHVLSPDIWFRRDRVRSDGKRTNFKRDILDVMRNKIDGSLLIKILRSVAQELKV